MRIQFHQLSSHLRSSLAPIYLICGEEPLQLGDAAGAVREQARKQGFEEREILEQESGFDWGSLAAAADALSLFASRKLIELRIGGARIGREGAVSVGTFCERLLSWIGQRLRSRGLQPAAGVAALLAERVEGNLLAAAQEIEKLRLLYGAGELDCDRLASAISDSARYDVFDLGDAALRGNRSRVSRILDGLAAEGAAPALVLWVLMRELRMLAAAAFAAPRGAGALAAALDAHKVWESRRSLVRAALGRLSLPRLHELIARCALIDRQIKGLMPGDPWQTLARAADDLAGSGSRGELALRLEPQSVLLESGNPV